LSAQTTEIAYTEEHRTCKTDIKNPAFTVDEDQTLIHKFSKEKGVTNKDLLANHNQQVCLTAVAAE